MAGIPKVKITFDADFDELKKGVKGATDEVEGFGSRVGDFAKKAGVAFAIAGAAAAAYAAKLLVDGVKSAIEDEAAQAKLATTLGNVTKATEDQIAQVEAQILKTSLLTGVTDEQLRPSLDRLVRSTKNVEEAQKLQSLALDIAAGTGKDLQAVSEALAKAHDGNFTALKKLGGGIDENILKSKDFDAATAALAKTFEGQASKQADTFAGKMDRLKVAFDEGKETVGAFILDAITPIITVILDRVVPAIETFIANIGGAEGLGAAFKQVSDFAQKFFTPIINALKEAFDNIKKAVVDNKDEFETLFKFLKDFVAPFLSGALSLAIKGIGTALSVVINFVGDLIAGFEKVIELAKKVKDAIGGVFGSSPIGRSNTNVGSIPAGASNRMPRVSRNVGQTINITVNGAVDAIGSARQIAQILSREATTSGTFSNLGVSKIVSLT